MHILEGLTSDGQPFTACSRQRPAARDTPGIGRAHILSRARELSEVTCAKCRAIYAAALKNGTDGFGRAPNRSGPNIREAQRKTKRIASLRLAPDVDAELRKLSETLGLSLKQTIERLLARSRACEEIRVTCELPLRDEHGHTSYAATVGRIQAIVEWAERSPEKKA